MTHELKVALRNLLKYKMQTAVTLIGWALGLACLALSAYWLRYEQTFDTGHPEADRLYFLAVQDSAGTVHGQFPASYCTQLNQQFPEVECATMINNMWWNVQLDSSVSLPCTYIDEKFLDVFRVPLIDGTKEFLYNPTFIALSESLARKLYGDSPAVGREISVDGRRLFVGAVIDNFKGHSNFNEDVLQYMTRGEDSNTGEYCLMRLVEDVEPDVLAHKINQVFKDKLSAREAFRLIPINQFRSELLTTQPVRTVYLRLFVLISSLIVLSILVNYYAFFSSRLRKRWREMAIRQVCGASLGRLFGLLMTEFLILLAGSVLLGFILLELLLPTFRERFMIPIQLEGLWIYMLLPILALWMGYVLLFLIFTRRTLRRNLSPSHSTLGNKINLTFQLTLTTLILFCVSVMTAQVNYLASEKSLGFEPRDRITLYCSQTEWQEIAALIRKQACVQQTLFGANLLNDYFMTFPITEWEEKEKDAPPVRVDYLWGDQTWMDFWEIRLLEGHVPTTAEAEKGYVLINETARHAFGWHDAVGKYFSDGTHQFRVAGVLKNFSVDILVPQAPFLLIRPGLSAFSAEEAQTTYCKSLLIKTEDGAVPELYQDLNALGPEISYISAAKIVEINLRSELLLLKLLWLAAALCVGVAVFCVYSLIALACEQRRKEIAIRKINGATTGDIWWMWCREYMLLWLLSLVVAFPAGYILMRRWLEQYVHQISIGAGYYAAVAIAIGLLVLLGMGTRVWKASRRQPADDIRIDS